MRRGDDLPHTTYKRYRTGEYTESLRLIFWRVSSSRYVSATSRPRPASVVIIGLRNAQTLSIAYCPGDSVQA